jgi:hypothetical protein
MARLSLVEETVAGNDEEADDFGDDDCDDIGTDDDVLRNEYRLIICFFRVFFKNMYKSCFRGSGKHLSTIKRSKESTNCSKAVSFLNFYCQA